MNIAIPIMERPPTVKQRNLLSLVASLTRMNRLPPTLSELETAQGVSRSGIQRMITALVWRGLLERIPNTPRGLLLTKMGAELLKAKPERAA